jgi:hypothetical protein
MFAWFTSCAKRGIDGVSLALATVSKAVAKRCLQEHSGRMWRNCRKPYRYRARTAHARRHLTRLDKSTYLHDRPEMDTFKLLIDSFRIRQADDFEYQNKTTPPSIYTGAPSSTAPFRQYLDRATASKSLLPPWWIPEKIEECVTFGESGAWSDVRKKVTKHEVTQHYGYEKMPGVQLRMLFDKEDERWKDKPSDYEAYYQDHIRRILNGEGIYAPSLELYKYTVLY